MSGRVPHRVDAATKAALLGLLDDAVERGWTLRAPAANWNSARSARTAGSPGVRDR